MSDLPNNWRRCALGEVLDYGSAPKVEPERIPASAWILELEDIEKETSRILAREIASNRRPKSTKNRFRRGDVLYGKLRPYLNKVVIADQDGYSTTEIIPLNANGKLDQRYLFYWLKSPEFLDYVTTVSHGINMPRLGTAAGRSAPLVVAPLYEQRRIADKLDDLIGRIVACSSRLDRVSALTRRLRLAVLHSAQVGTLTEEWRRESKNCTEWDQCTVGQVATVGTGSTPSRSRADFYAAEGIPWITSAATAKNTILSADEYVTENAIAAHRLRIYAPGTLLIAMYGEGKTRGQVSELGIYATINQACAALIVDPTAINPRFVKLMLQANYLNMRALAEGGNQPNLNLSKVREFKLPRPCREEQDEIVARVDKLLSLIDSLNTIVTNARTRLSRLAPAALAKAFRGEFDTADTPSAPKATS